ncbi:hypothetical protein [Streptomyces albidoflavus]|uniref:hypothetical protein n=1 Tax=Streptomyces albidoflavus TaxID=1886 RepID=UPI00101E2B92|nr:hypothetical protein [Streptomyces albidoflavus]
MKTEMRVLARVLRAAGPMCRLMVETTPGSVELSVRPGEAGGAEAVDAIAAALGTTAGVTPAGGAALYTVAATVDGVGVVAVHLPRPARTVAAPRRTSTADLVAALDTLVAWLPPLPAGLDPVVVLTDSGAAVHAQIRVTDGLDAANFARDLVAGLTEAPWPARGADTTVLLPGGLPLSIHRLTP